MFFTKEGEEMSKMDLTKAEDLVLQHFSSGYHCSESVTRALLETLYGEANPVCMRISNPFMGGIAGTKVNACGALSGGMIVLGYRYGRTLPQEDDSLLVELSKQFYRQFHEAIGLDSVDCQVLYDNRKTGSCNQYVTTATRLVLQIIAAQENDPALKNTPLE